MLSLKRKAHETVDRASGKRRPPCCPESSPSEDTTQCPSKKQRLAHHGLSHPDFPPKRFWEGLSKQNLTRNALRALQSVGSLPLPNLRPRRSHRLASRRVSEPTTDQQPAESFLRSCSPATLKRIRRFASHGGPDLRDVTGYRFTGSKQKMSTRESSLGRRKRGSQSPVKSSGTPTTTTKSTGPYDGNFQQHLTNHRVYPARYTYPDGTALPRPDNLDEIRRILGQRRPSLSPSQFSEGAFDAFQDADAHAAKEAQVMARVVPIMEGKLEDPSCVAGQIPFRNLDHLTDDSLVPGNPDVYYGVRPEELRPTISHQIEGHIVPSRQDSLPVAPNFFLHVKGPDGSLSVASRQACYDGALGARGIHSLQSYGQSEQSEHREQRYDNKAYTLTSTYHGGQLKMYTSHPIPPRVPGERPGFAMTQIKSWSLTGDADTFQEGAAAYRNGRDWAKRQRDSAIKQENEKVTGAEADTSSLGDALGLNFASAASTGDTMNTSQETVLGFASNVPPSC